MRLASADCIYTRHGLEYKWTYAAELIAQSKRKRKQSRVCARQRMNIFFLTLSLTPRRFRRTGLFDNAPRATRRIISRGSARKSLYTLPITIFTFHFSLSNSFNPSIPGGKHKVCAPYKARMYIAYLTKYVSVLSIEVFTTF